MKSQFKYSLPAYKSTSRGGQKSNFTVTSGQYAGKNFKTKKDFDTFFAQNAAKKQLDFEATQNKYKKFLQQGRRSRT
tara:strand:- start:292 stop:522 length:231 start_codon:yes stop_codon:yes gene_type:complete